LGRQPGVASNSKYSSGVAGRYATALYELAHDARQLDEVAADLTKLSKLVAENADLRRLISSPLLPRAEQAKAMDAVIAKVGVSDLTRRFIGTVARNRRLFALNTIIHAFHAMLAERRGELTAEVTAAKPLSPAQIEAVSNALRGSAGTKIQVDVKVDPKLLGGLKVKVGSRLIDASLATKLQRLQLAMKGLG
jgi:F-type H+-transporting ATPase subunit delta